MAVKMFRHSWMIAAAAAAIAIVAPRPAAAQGQTAIEQRIAELEKGQQQILQELKELKTLLQQMRPPMPPPGGAQPPQAPPNPAAKPAAPQLPDFDLLIAGSPSKGKADAPLVIMEFSDFECPFCGRYARDTYAQVIKEFVDTGKARYVFRHLPIESLHPRALRASQAAECAHGQGRFWDYHDRLFANQQALSDPDLTRHAQALTLNMPAFEKCMAEQKVAAPKVRQDQGEGGRAGVTGTPTFFIGTVTKDGRLKALRRLVGAHPITNFRTTIESLLAEKK
ncbi:MAG TPA: DsbA family protein [Vicinamibacterales bacterium]